MIRTLLLALLVLPACAYTNVGPGHAGVLWSADGGTQRTTFGEGQHHTATEDQMSIYDLRTTDKDEALSVIASNGLGIKLDASVLYHADPKEIVALEEEIGPDYYTKVLAPILRSEARRVIGQYTPEEIYSTKRDVIERQIFDGVGKKLAGRHIVLEAVLIRGVDLPDAIERAIDQKLQAEQDVQKMKYVLEVAKAKAEEQRVTAAGVADYNRTIASSLTPSILEFQRTQQLTALATSSNSKTVVLGQGSAPTLTVPTK